MAFARKSYSEITETVLSQITKGIVNEKHDYVINRTKYRLEQPKVLDIVKIDGTLKNSPIIFRKNIDYKLIGNMVEWLAPGEKPDDHTSFFVNYKLDAPQLITDINPGSVVRTIVESLALEVDFLYAQMNQIYNSGFIDTATGKSLDLMVSILGIIRKMPGFASGEVTFGRNKEPSEVEILREAHIYDGKNRFGLKNTMVKRIKNVEGISGGIQTVLVNGQDFNLSENMIEWIEIGKKLDKGSAFYVDYTAYEQIIIPLDTKVSTYSRTPENLKIFRTTREAILIKNANNKWEFEVPVVAISPGKEGNVFAGSINVMPKPLMGIEYIINKKDILNGTDEENDSDLRKRAKSALEKAGKASITSLKSAVQGVEGVVGEVRVVDQPDGVPGIVQIIAGGGDDKEIMRVIEETRSAGIKVEFKRPTIIPLDINLTISIVEGIDAAEVKKEVERMIYQYVDAQNIDDDVVLSRIIVSALSVQGVKDVKDVTINGKKENVEVKSDEKGELRTPPEIFVED